jgi:diguanylate cyclase (GGDEF)-like protein
MNSLTGDLPTALSYLHKGIEIAKEIGSRVIEAKGYRYLAELYEARSDYKNCFRYFKTYRALQDEVAGTDMADKIARTELAHEIETKEKEAEIHRLKNVELEREIEERKRAEESLKESEDRFRTLSIEDPLTGVFNRRYFFETAVKIIDRSERDECDICLGMFDIDYFKKINDRYGHQAGDYILREFVGITAKCIRPNDLLARYGGEEFVLLFHDCELMEATTIMIRINETIEKHEFSFNETGIPVTVSGGVANIAEVDSREDILEEMVKLADKRMYMAKQSGRNCIINK